MAALRQKKTDQKTKTSQKAKSVAAVEASMAHSAVPSPAKQLQSQLHAHYAPLHKKLAVTLVSLLVAFAVMNGWNGGVETSFYL